MSDIISFIAQLLADPFIFAIVLVVVFLVVYNIVSNQNEREEGMTFVQYVITSVILLIVYFVFAIRYEIAYYFTIDRNVIIYCLYALLGIVLFFIIKRKLESE
ncbi:MAG: hypothetical protein ACTSP4_00135 [Candidatus Hodarchaeales archaeon]